MLLELNVCFERLKAYFEEISTKYRKFAFNKYFYMFRGKDIPFT